METLTNQTEFTFSKETTTNFYEFNELFKELYKQTWVVFGKEYNLSEMGWAIGYNSRKRALGVCRYRRNSKVGTVKISKTLLEQNFDKAYDFEDTIRHEIAHAIHVIITGKSSHDHVWKAIAREVGADDTRCHEGFLEQPKGKYTLTCPSCGTTTEKYRKIKRQKACGKCCVKHANGRFDQRFIFTVTQNY